MARAYVSLPGNHQKESLLNVKCGYKECKQVSDLSHFTSRLNFNPVDPNPDIAARVVFPQSGHSHLERWPFFHIFPHFSKIEPSKRFLPHMGSNISN